MGLRDLCGCGLASENAAGFTELLNNAIEIY